MSSLADSPGTEFEADVIDLSGDGRGVLKHPQGRTFFVSGVWPGERVRVKVRQIKGRIGFADCLEVLEKSQARIEPPCPYQGFGINDCGGCPWQFVNYQDQLAAKQQRVNAAFSRLGAEQNVAAIVASPEPWAYRNRAQLKSNGRELGFVSANSNRIVDVKECLVLNPTVQSQLTCLRQQLPEKQWRPRGKHRWVTLDVDDDMSLDELQINRRRPFKQANTEQNEGIRQWLSEKLQAQGNGKAVLELFAGSGNLTEVILKSGAAKVWAVEVVDEAVSALSAMGASKLNALQADLFSDKGMAKALFQAKEAQILVVDPPRDGLKVAGDLYAKKNRFTDVFYISCDLATLVRDVARFKELGFTVAQVLPVDQFPHTPHIELCVHLKK